MKEHIIRETPHEACGILAGQKARTAKGYPMKNIAAMSHIRYSMQPEEQISVLREIRKLGMELVAVYHSHVNCRAYPSQTDITNAHYRDISYVIISVHGSTIHEVNSFRFNNGYVEREEVKIY